MHNNNNKEYHYTFLRHATSVFNENGTTIKDPGLSKNGIEMAKNLKGNYDYILVSCMRRTSDTYAYSLIEGDIVEYSTLCREYIGDEDHYNSMVNLMKNEKSLFESNDEFMIRMNILKEYIISKGNIYDKILIITHYDVIKALTDKGVKNGVFVGLNKF